MAHQIAQTPVVGGLIMLIMMFHNSLLHQVQWISKRHFRCRKTYTQRKIIALIVTETIRAARVFRSRQAERANKHLGGWRRETLPKQLSKTKCECRGSVKRQGFQRGGERDGGMRWREKEWYAVERYPWESLHLSSTIWSSAGDKYHTASRGRPLSHQNPHAGMFHSK